MVAKGEAAQLDIRIASHCNVQRALQRALASDELGATVAERDRNPL